MEGVLLIPRIEIKLPSNLPQNQLPIIIREIPKIDRRRHHRINAERLLLDFDVSKVYFKKVLDELESKGKIYKNIWKIKRMYVWKYGYRPHPRGGSRFLSRCL